MPEVTVTGAAAAATAAPERPAWARLSARIGAALMLGAVLTLAMINAFGTLGRFGLWLGLAMLGGFVLLIAGLSARPAAPPGGRTAVRSPPDR
jgi:hypothetical protein